MLVLTAVISVGMLQIDWNGVAGSTEADDIDLLTDVMIVLSAFVYSIVLVMLGYSIWRYRAKPGDESDGEPIHGNTRLEIAWTVIPTVIVLFGAGYSWFILDEIEARDADRLQVDVTAQQFAWRFEYPEEGVTSTELHVPVDRQAEFNLKAIDVIHAFWVPGVAGEEGRGSGAADERRRHPRPRRRLRDRVHGAVRRRALDDAGAGGRRVRGGLRPVGLGPGWGGRRCGGARRRRRGGRGGRRGPADLRRPGLQRLPHVRGGGRDADDRTGPGRGPSGPIPAGDRAVDRRSRLRALARLQPAGSCPTTSATR